jgi:molybdopterin-binding protein
MMDIRVENLGRMAGGKRILEDIDLMFSPDTVNVILGPNGAGKSTLLRLLGLLDRPDRGEICYDGRRLGAMTRSERTRLRRRCGFVFQAPLLLAGSVEANLRFGARLRGLSIGAVAVSEVLEQTGLAGKESQEARLLSGGEKQRLQLARVMLLGPDLYLLDEPTANLDPLSVKNIEIAITRLARSGKTVILATHNLIQARLLAGRVVFLKAGRLVQSGSAAEVLSRPLSLDIAEFSAAENIIAGTLSRRGESMFLDCGPLAIEVVSERAEGRAAAVIRPEDILVSLEPIASSARNSFRGTVLAVADLGAVMALSVDCRGIVFSVFLTRISCSQMQLASESRVSLAFKATSVHLLPQP